MKLKTFRRHKTSNSVSFSRLPTIHLNGLKGSPKKIKCCHITYPQVVPKRMSFFFLLLNTKEDVFNVGVTMS